MKSKTYEVTISGKSNNDFMFKLFSKWLNTMADDWNKAVKQTKVTVLEIARESD